MTGCADSELRVWKISYRDDNNGGEQQAEAVRIQTKRKVEEEEEDEVEAEENSVSCWQTFVSNLILCTTTFNLVFMDNQLFLSLH